MADVSKQFEIGNILSYCDDLVEVLRSNRDVNNLTRCLDHSSAVQSSFAADFEEFQSLIHLADCQKKIDDCQQKTDEARSSVVPDEEIDSLRNVPDEEICREDSHRGELRYVFTCASTIEDKIDELDEQRLLIETRRQLLKILEAGAAKARTFFHSHPVLSLTPTYFLHLCLFHLKYELPARRKLQAGLDLCTPYKCTRRVSSVTQIVQFLYALEEH
ncbi:hypothetical protein V2J09_010109 [Rumex salicifolius]